MSRLRAKCPDCGTYTAVALGPEYECHACGRAFARRPRPRPRAWGEGGECDGRGGAGCRCRTRRRPSSRRTRSRADPRARLRAPRAPARPRRVLLLARRRRRRASPRGTTALAVVWLDAHGDLNTPETSPSGNQWGMPLRMLLDAGAVERRRRRAGRRAQPRPARGGVHRWERPAPRRRRRRARARRDDRRVYVALRRDVLDPGESASFMPEPGGLTLAERSERARCASAAIGRRVARRRVHRLRRPANVEPSRGSRRWACNRPPSGQV